MSNRYANIPELKSKFIQKRYLSSVIYPKIKPTDNDVYIISEQGDRLDLLAHKYYGDVGLWWIIAVANNLNEATISIEEGLQLRIPSEVGVILNNFRKLNN